MLRFTKFLEEGVNDPAIFKAIFLAGGPGSGKSFIAGKTGLKALGYKVVNSDDAFEAAMKKAGMDMDPENIFSPAGQTLRGKAKVSTDKKQDRYIKGRLGLLIDGTGKDPSKVAKQAQELKKLGYDVAMILVNTDLQTSVSRDAARKRTIGAKGVGEYWSLVQKNIGKLQRIFGKPNFLVVDNSDVGDEKAQKRKLEKETTRAYRDAVKFTNKPVTDAVATKWIEREKESRGITK